MTHDELLAKINKLKEDAEGDVWLIHNDRCCGNCVCEEVEEEVTSIHNALRAVVELHKPIQDKKLWCEGCRVEDDDWYSIEYPCPTIQAIEKELRK